MTTNPAELGLNFRLHLNFVYGSSEGQAQIIDMAGQIFVNSMLTNEKTSSSKLAVICLHLTHNHNHFDALTILFLSFFIKIFCHSIKLSVRYK